LLAATGKAQMAEAEPSAKARILFVDDEPSMLRVLKMGMRSMNGIWEMEFAENGEAALALIQNKAFDVVVTDMRMPGINGAQLLNQVLRIHPHTVRIILSGYSDLSEVVNCVGLTHQFLEKPCTLDDLKDCLKRVTAVKERLGNDQLRELTGGLKNLPSVPALYLEIVDALQSATVTAQRIAEIVSRDPALSAKLLQISNSAFFGFSRKVYSVDEAVQLLGVSVIQSLAMAVPIFSSFSRAKCPTFPIEQVWEHSLQTAIIGRRIYSQHLNDSLTGEQAFCAGILHDVGKIILASELPDKYSAVLQESLSSGKPLYEVEQSHFGATHSEVGGYLLALWGLPIPLVEAVANHHNPRRCGVQELCLAGVVHIANALEYYKGDQKALRTEGVDSTYLKFIGLERQFSVWRADVAARAAAAADSAL
jgi:HD-like signal output (HDOD) protein/ActR/RegA family two-component response regulator